MEFNLNIVKDDIVDVRIMVNDGKLIILTNNGNITFDSGSVQKIWKILEPEA